MSKDKVIVIEIGDANAKGETSFGPQAMAVYREPDYTVPEANDGMGNHVDRVNAVESTGNAKLISEARSCRLRRSGARCCSDLTVTSSALSFTAPATGERRIFMSSN